VKALRDIYSSEADIRVKNQIRGQSQTKLRNNHFNRAKQFQCSESRKRINDENKRMAEKLYSIQYAHSPSRENLKENDSLRKLQAKNLINRKKLVYENLNRDNLRMHDRLTSQKGQISFSKLENEFARNREHIDRITKYKFDGDKVLFSGCLVSQDGRFRVPGSKYTSIKNLRPSSRKSKINGEESRLSVCSSQRSARSRQSSQLTNRKASTQNGLRVSSRSTSKNRLRVSGGDFFEQKNSS